MFSTAKVKKNVKVPLLAGIFALIAIAARPLPAATLAPLPPPTILTIASWGGAYEESQRKAYFEPFERANPSIKIKIVNASGDQVARLREQAAKKAIEWDLVDVAAADAIRLCKEKIAAPVDIDKLLQRAPDDTVPSSDFGQAVVSPCFIPEIVYSTTIGYRSDVLSVPPTSICDIFDLHRFPGKRALEKRPINNLEWALVCDGVDPDKVYEVLDTPDGIERALLRLDTLRGNVVWWTDGNEPAELLRSGAVVMASAYNGRLFDLVTKKNPKVKMLWDRQVFDFDGWIIPEGGKNRAAVETFLKFATSTDRLAAQASYIPYGPARRSSALLVGKHATLGIDMQPFLPTAPDNAKTTLIYNYDWWATNRDALDKRFADWLVKGP